MTNATVTVPTVSDAQTGGSTTAFELTNADAFSGDLVECQAHSASAVFVAPSTPGVFHGEVNYEVVFATSGGMKIASGFMTTYLYGTSVLP